MLSLLHIENIAVIECAEITFDRGFNVLTGETGAGKSIVIDAISAILGERAYRDMIRTGTNKASVRAVFTDVPEFPWFTEHGVPYDPETIIHREVYLDGKNVCRVNGALVTVEPQEERRHAASRRAAVIFSFIFISITSGVSGRRLLRRPPYTRGCRRSAPHVLLRRGRRGGCGPHGGF